MLPDIRERIVTEAWTWKDTPYVDHAGVKGCGVDCAFFPLRVAQSVGLIDVDYKPPRYSPQAWLNSPVQTDKRKLKFEDTTFLKIVQGFAKREIGENEVRPGDLVLYRIVASWTHAAIVIQWPDTVLHPIVGLGVISSHGFNDGMLRRRPRRYFTLVD
jgi:cell wall-associated NlpC family hydrolase